MGIEGGCTEIPPFDQLRAGLVYGSWFTVHSSWFLFVRENEKTY
jgi:hypothetical protein